MFLYPVALRQFQHRVRESLQIRYYPLVELTLLLQFLTRKTLKQKRDTSGTDVAVSRIHLPPAGCDVQ